MLKATTHFIKWTCTESIIDSANFIAKVKKPFSIGKELILPALRTLVMNFKERLQFKGWHVFLFQLAS